MIKKDKYVWWGLLGIGVAAFFYFLSSQKGKGAEQSSIAVPYLVPQTSNVDNSLSEQSNIVGNHGNSTLPNGSVGSDNQPNPISSIGIVDDPVRPLPPGMVGIEPWISGEARLRQVPPPGFTNQTLLH